MTELGFALSARSTHPGFAFTFLPDHFRSWTDQEGFIRFFEQELAAVGV